MVDAAGAGASTRPTATSRRCRRSSPQLSPDVVFFPHTYQTRDFAPALAARLGRPLVTDVIGIQRVDERTRVRASDVPGQAQRRRHGRRAGAASRHRPDRRVPRRRAARGAAPAPCARPTSPSTRAAIRQKPEAPFKEAKQAVDLSQAERIVAVGPRHQGAGAPPDRRAAGRGAGRRAGGLAADLRRRLAADGSPDRQLRPDRRAAALRRARASPAPSSTSSA